MAGTITIALTQRPDAAGGKLHWYRAGTVSTPQNAFYDSDLTLPLANPYELDEDGNIPFFFLADGSIKITLIDKHGNSLLSADNIPVIGSSSGGGGGGTVDPTTVWRTGDLKARYGTGVHDGFVRANGRTIGSATSGATELTSSSAQALFLFLWAEDINLAVSGGRGASAADDWAANKTIALPDWRGCAIAGLDDMGNSASGRLSSTYFSGSSPIILGTSGGTQSHTLTLAETPAGITTTGVNAISVTNSAPITSTGNNSISASGVNSISASGNNSISVTSTISNILRSSTHDNYASIAGDAGFIQNVTNGSVTSTNPSQAISVSNASQNISVANASQAISVSVASGAVTSTGNNTITGTSNNTSGGAHSIVQPTRLATIYIKL